MDWYSELARDVAVSLISTLVIFVLGRALGVFANVADFVAYLRARIAALFGGGRHDTGNVWTTSGSVIDRVLNILIAVFYRIPIALAITLITALTVSSACILVLNFAEGDLLSSSTQDVGFWFLISLVAFASFVVLPGLIQWLGQGYIGGIDPLNWIFHDLIKFVAKLVVVAVPFTFAATSVLFVVGFLLGEVPRTIATLELSPSTASKISTFSEALLQRPNYIASSVFALLLSAAYVLALPTNVKAIVGATAVIWASVLFVLFGFALGGYLAQALATVGPLSSTALALAGFFICLTLTNFVIIYDKQRDQARA